MAKSKMPKTKTSQKKSVKQVERKTERVLIQTRIPRPSMKVEGSGDDWKIRGIEVYHRINTTAENRVQYNPLNPVRGEVFPRLSNLALCFQRFCFRRVRLRYHSACPATRSGGIGLVVLEQPPAGQLLGSLPTDFVSLGSYPNSAVGTVGLDLVTPWYLPKNGGEKFFISYASDDGKDDPFKIFQGTVMIMTGDSTSTDAHLLAGYVSIEYELDLYGYRVPDQASLLMSSNCAFQFIGGNAATQLVSWGVDSASANENGFVQQSTGYFPCDYFSKIKSDTAPVTQSDFAVVPKCMNILKGSRASMLLPLSAVIAMDDDKQLDPYGRPVMIRTTERKSSIPRLTEGEVVVYYDPSLVAPDGPNWVPDESIPGPDDRPVFKRASLMPATAGDVTVNVYALDIASAALTLLATSIFSSGTGGFAAGVSFNLISDFIRSTILAYVVPTGTEKRALVTDGSVNSSYPKLSVLIPEDRY